MYQTCGVSLMILFTIAIAVLIYMLITEKLVFTIYIGILFDIRKREITAIFRDEILVAFDNYAIDK